MANTNSFALDGSEYVQVERAGFTQRLPITSLATYTNPDSVTTATTSAAIAAALIAGGVKMAETTLAALDTGGGVAAWANPEAGAIAIIRCLIDVTTVSTGAATIDIGTTAVSATTTSDNLLDGLDVNAATGLFDNLLSPGTNGKALQRLAAGKWVTASMASGACAGLAGSLYVLYIVL